MSRCPDVQMCRLADVQTCRCADVQEECRCAGGVLEEVLKAMLLLLS